MIEQARAFLRDKADRQARDLDRLFDQATRDCAAIRDLIVAHYAPRRIVQWGSLLRRDRFRVYSDIDLAVEGVSDPETFFRMYGEAERLTSFPVDLIDMDRIEPEFAEIIRAKGVVVYER